MGNWLNRLWKQLPHTTGRGGRRKSSPRPSVESLEQRLAPAWDLTISGAPTVGVVQDAQGNFTAAAHGANIAVSDILLNYSKSASISNIHVSDGTTGKEPGNITWLAGNDLDFANLPLLPNRTLTISTDPSAAAGDVTLNSRIFDHTAPSVNALAVNVSARGNLQVNADILAGSSPVSLAAGVNPDGSANPGTGVLTIGALATVSGSNVTLRGADVNIQNNATNPVNVIATGGNQSYLAVPVANPSAVAVDAHGNLFVGNALGGTVLKVTPAGVVTTYATGFSDVTGLAFDAAGNLYVSDGNRGTVSKVTPAGVVTVFASGLSNPNALAFDAHGNLFIANYGTNTVKEVTPAGAVSTLPYSFSGPLGLTFDSHGNLYVANTFTGTVSEVTAKGVSTFLTGFFGPQGIAFDALGNFYVAESGHSWVTKVTPTGTRSTFVQGTAGGGAIAFDAQGNLYVGDLYYNQVRKVTPAGAASVYVNNAKYDPQGVAYDAGGNLFFASPAGNTVNRLTPAGVLTTWSGFSTPGTVAVDARGNVYVTNYGNGTVSKITPAGVVSTFATGFVNPNGLAFDARGNLFVANFGNGTVSEVTPDGVVSTYATGFTNPCALAFDAAGDLFVADETANTVSVIKPGAPAVLFAAGLDEPIGLAFDVRGNLYIANFGTNKLLANAVEEVGPVGNIITRFRNFNHPYGLAFDPQGNLLVANNGNTSFSRLGLGNVTIRSSLPARPIQVGGTTGTAAGINLSSAELARINALSSITIGDPTQTGNITFTNAFFSTQSVQVVESPTGPGRIILDDAHQNFALDNFGGAVILTAGTGGIQEINNSAGSTGIYAAQLQLNTLGSAGSLVQPLSLFVTDLGPGSVGGSLFLSDRGPLTTGGPLTVGTSAYLTLLDNFFTHAGDIVARAINLTFNGNQDEELDGGGQVFSNVLHRGTGTLRLVGDGLTDKGNLTNAPGAGNFDANDLPVTVTGLTTIDGGIYLAGAGAQVFKGGLVVNGSFVGGSGTVTTGGVTISLYGTFIAPSTTLIDTGNWTDAGGIFDANGGTVVLSGSATQLLNAGWQDFFNLTHTGVGTLSLVMSPLTIDGHWTSAAGAGVVSANGLVITILNMM